jgi:hypothetical protein
VYIRKENNRGLHNIIKNSDLSYAVARPFLLFCFSHDGSYNVSYNFFFFLHITIMMKLLRNTNFNILHLCMQK